MLSPTEGFRAERAFACGASVRLVVHEPSKAAQMVAGTIVANEIDAMIIERCQGKGRERVLKAHVVVLT